MRLLTCLAGLACLTLAGCATTAQNRPDDRPTAASQKVTGYCSSSGGGIACASMIAVSAVLHSVQN
jgi:hypothetical protein